VLLGGSEEIGAVLIVAVPYGFADIDAVLGITDFPEPNS
jgi:hypothetical protein